MKQFYKTSNDILQSNILSFSPSYSIDSALIEDVWYQQKSPEFNEDQVDVYMNMSEHFNCLKASHLKTFGCPIRFENGLKEILCQ